MRFAFIEVHVRQFAVTTMCRVLQVSRAGYYAWVHAELAAQGQRHGRKRVARIMRARGIRAKTVRRFRRTTNSHHAHPIAPNTLDRQCAVAQVGAPNRVWVGDITYLRTREGWLYLAIVLDLGGRRVIGWAMRHTLDGALTEDALTMALRSRQPGPGVLHYTDRGSQYAATDYRALLTAHGMDCSMSRVGDCWDSGGELLRHAQAGTGGRRRLAHA